MALHEVLSQLPWSLILAATGMIVVGLAYWKREDVFEDFGFGTREVAFVIFLPIAGWSVNFPLFILGKSTLALNLGGALVPIILSGWILYRGYLEEIGAAVTLLAVVVTSIVAFEVVTFEPELGIVAEFPFFFLPALAASGITLLLLARRDARTVPAAYIAGSLGALIGADLMHFPEIGPYMLSASRPSVLSVGGAGALDMVFLSGLMAMAFNLIVVVLVNPYEPPERTSWQPAFAYPAGLELVHDPQRYVIAVDKRRTAGRYISDQERARYHLAQGDRAWDRGQPDRVLEEARQAVRVALRRAREDETWSQARSNDDLRDDLRYVLDADIDDAEEVEDVLTTAKLLVRVLHRGDAS